MTRYVWKYRSSDNEIVLKVTDDVQHVQYRTHQSNELKLMEQWNYIMLKLTTTKKPEPASILAEIEEETKAEREAKKKGGAGSTRKAK